MRCIRCRRDLPNDVVVCECGFQFDNVDAEDLDSWFNETKTVLETAYLEANTPWQQSGKGGTFAEWTRLRIPVAEAITTSGTFLDIGCANGFLIECVLEWIRYKNIDLIPYGIDFAPEVLTLAKKRLPQYAEYLFVGNGLTWQPPDGQRFDYVRTSIEYVPTNYQQQALEHALSLVAEGGKLLVAQYRSRQDDLSLDWIDDFLTELGYTVAFTTHGYSGKGGLELCRVAVIGK